MKKYYQIIGDKELLTKRQLKKELNNYKVLGYNVSFIQVSK